LLAWSRQSRCHLGRQGGAGRLAQHIHFGWCCNGLVGNCAATPLLRMSGMGVLQPWLVLTPPGPWVGLVWNTFHHLCGCAGWDMRLDCGGSSREPGRVLLGFGSTCSA